MKTYVLLVTHEPTKEAAAALSRLRFMLRMRGVQILADRPLTDAGLAQELTRAVEAPDETVSLAIFVDTDASDEPYQRWLEEAGRLAAATRAPAFLLSARGPAQRGRFPPDLREAAVIRLDRPLGFHRACDKVGAAPFLGTRVEKTGALDARSQYFSDTPTDEDGLGRAALAGRVCEVIHAADRPLTISIEGLWGSGKSSFLRLIREELQQPPDDGSGRKPVRIVEFNPWRLDKADSLWAAFAITFYEQLYTLRFRNMVLGSDRAGAFHDLWARARLARARFDLRRGLLPLAKVVGLVAAVVLGGLATLWPAATRHAASEVVTRLAAADDAGVSADGDAGAPDGGGEPAAKAAIGGAEDKPPRAAAAETKDHTLQLFALLLVVPSFAGFARFVWSMKPEAILKEAAAQVKAPDYEAKLPFAQQFQEDFAKVVAAFSRYRVIVLIDDVDRCEPAVAAELCQAISLMVPESSDMVFIVAMDREKVAAGIAARAEKILPILAATREGARGFDGPRALDYGFQFLEKSVQLSVRLPPVDPRRLSQIARDAPADLQELVELVAGVLGHNPRRAKHFLNMMRLHAHLLDGNRRTRVTRVQLAKLFAITLRWPRIAQDLAEEPTLLVDLEEIAIDPGAQAAKAPPGSALSRWVGEDDLRKLLATKLEGRGSAEEAHRYTFLGVDVLHLLGARKTLAQRAAGARG